MVTILTLRCGSMVLRRCDRSCYMAKGSTCCCVCEGRFHALGRIPSEDDVYVGLLAEIASKYAPICDVVFDELDPTGETFAFMLLSEPC